MIIPIAHAASEAQLAAQCLVEKINANFLFPLITLMSAVAFIVFLWGCFQYVKSADNPQGREVGQRHILYGLIGMLIMLSAFALLNIAAGTFRLGEGGGQQAQKYNQLLGLQGGGACDNLRMQNSGGNDGVYDASNPIYDDPSRITDGPI